MKIKMLVTIAAAFIFSNVCSAATYMRHENIKGNVTADSAKKKKKTSVKKKGAAQRRNKKRKKKPQTQ